MNLSFLKKRRIFSLGGFSLVEVVIAALLLAVVTAGIFSVTLSSHKLISRSHQRHSAYEVAQTVFERLRAELGSNKWYNTSSFLYPTSAWNCYNLSSSDPLEIYNFFAGSDFTAKYNVRWCYIVTNGTSCGGSGCDYRNVTVNVTWNELL